MTPDMHGDTELPRYRCHKEVHALLIAAIEINEDGSATIAPADDGYAPFRTTPNFPFKGSEADLGFFVLYEGGYQSWSPTAAFVAGYTRLPRPSPARFFSTTTTGP